MKIIEDNSECELDQHKIDCSLQSFNQKTQEDTSIPNQFLKQQRKTSGIVKCEYCHNQFSQKDYMDHKVFYLKDNHILTH